MSADTSGGRTPTSELAKEVENAAALLRLFKYERAAERLEARFAELQQALAARAPQSVPPIDHGGDDPYGLEARADV